MSQKKGPGGAFNTARGPRYQCYKAVRVWDRGRPVVKRVDELAQWVSDRDADRGLPRPRRVEPGVDALGIDGIRAHSEAKFRELNALRSGQFHVEIYPSGVVLTQAMGLPKEAPEGVVRGVISGFSDEASRRLKYAFLTLEVPGFELWAVTLTTHALLASLTWRAVMKRFRMGVKRRGWAGLWRVELQRRRTPHAHVAMWLPRGVELAAVESLWLECTGEAGDPAAVEHAVVGRRIPHDESGWAVYLALHDGKRKESQLGWLGKQWGIWNRELLVAREPERARLTTKRHHLLFLRCLARVDRSIREGQLRRREEADRAWLGEEIERGALPASLEISAGARFTLKRSFRSKGVFSVRVVRTERPRLPHMHRGNLLWCVTEDLSSRLVAAILSGQIGRADGA